MRRGTFQNIQYNYMYLHLQFVSHVDVVFLKILLQVIDLDVAYVICFVSRLFMLLVTADSIVTAKLRLMESIRYLQHNKMQTHASGKLSESMIYLYVFTFTEVFHISMFHMCSDLFAGYLFRL
jgi:hypothetical protein